MRQFNDDDPRGVRARRRRELRRARATRVHDRRRALALRLAYRAPLDARRRCSRSSRTRAVPGRRGGRGDGAYRRTLRLPHGAGRRRARAGATDHVAARCALDDLRDLDRAVAALPPAARPRRRPAPRRTTCSAADPAARAARRGARPGLRVPGAVDGAEIAVRAVLGQQVSVAAARTLAGRLVARFGEPLTAPDGALTHVFPRAAALADAPDEALRDAARRAGARCVGAGAAVAAGELDLERRRRPRRAAARLLALPGIGPWTAAYVAMRALRRPDAFPAADLGVLPRARGASASATNRPAASVCRAWRPVARLRRDAPLERAHDRPEMTRSPRRSAKLDLVAADGALAGVSLRRPPGRHHAARVEQPELPRARRAPAARVLRRQAARLRPAARAKGTPFQQRVWRALARSPTARPRSYGEQPRASAGPRRARGRRRERRATRSPIVVPCHRVIGADGSLTGYGGGLPTKRRLLDLERRPASSRPVAGRRRSRARRARCRRARSVVGHDSGAASAAPMEGLREGLDRRLEELAGPSPPPTASPSRPRPISPHQSRKPFQPSASRRVEQQRPAPSAPRTPPTRVEPHVPRGRQVAQRHGPTHR